MIFYKVASSSKKIKLIYCFTQNKISEILKIEFIINEYS